MPIIMGEQKKFTCIVLSKTEKADGCTVELDIPAFNSQYSTYINRVPDGIASRLVVGQPHSLILETQNLKKNQDQTIKSGQWPTDYYYGCVGIDGDDIPAPSGGKVQSPVQPTSPAQPAPTPMGGMTKDEQIARSVALKASVKFCGNNGIAAWETEADKMVAWLMYQPSALEVVDDPPF